MAKVGDISRAGRSGSATLSTADHFVDDVDLSVLKTRPVPSGSVLFAKIGEAIRHNHRVIAGRPMLIDNNAMAAVPNSPDLDARYLYRFLQSVDLYALTSSTTVPSLRKSDLARIRIPLPNFKEQRRIAAILDHADALRAKRRQTLSNLDSLRQSIFHDFFSDTPDAIEPLASIADRVVVGHVGPTTSYFRPAGVPFLRTGNVGRGVIIRKGLAHVSIAFHDRLRKSQLHAGDVLISRVISDEVRAAVLPVDLDGANCANIIIVRPSNRILAESVLGFIGLPTTQRRLLGRRVGSAQGVVNTTVLKEMLTPVYSASKQSHLKRVIQRIELQRDAFDIASLATDELFSSLQSRAFQGEI